MLLARMMERVRHIEFIVIIKCIPKSVSDLYFCCSLAHYHIFIGDLSPEINDEALGNAFIVFGNMTYVRL